MSSRVPKGARAMRVVTHRWELELGEEQERSVSERGDDE